MSAYGWDEPAPYLERDDGDLKYEIFRDRVDNGEQCPTCRVVHTAKREKACGIDLFQCAHCGSRWFDSVTRPTVEASQ